MTSLRNRIVFLLILAIVTVVGLATLAASRALQPPPMNERLATQARQLSVIFSYAERYRQAAVDAGTDVRDRPFAENVDPRFTDDLKAAIGTSGVQIDLLAAREEDSHRMWVSMKLNDNRWLVVELPDQGPPPGGLMTLAVWIVLIIIGSAAVSIYAAAKIIRPLKLVESAVGRIGPDGVLPLIPEEGPAEVKATAMALNRLSGRLKTAIESRMRLVAAAGHDLRTPMTRMRLRAEFVADEAEKDKWLADLKELDEIADSAMLLVREEVNSSSPEVLKFDGLIKDVVQELSLLSYRVQCKKLEPSNVTASPLAMRRAIRNLLINAATHGKKGTVQLVHRDGQAVVTIEDQGPGIPANLMGQVFEPFFRVDAARRRSMPGAGLGLAIAKEIIERFGGKIALSNRPEGGLSQQISLPITK